MHDIGVLLHSQAQSELRTQVGLGIVYTVTGAKSMQIIEVLAAGKQDEDVDLTKYIFIFGIVQLFLSQIKNFASLWWVSIVGALMALLYSAMAGILAIAAAGTDSRSPDYSKRGDGSSFWRGVFTSMGAITFAYAGQSVFLEIQATLRVPPPAKASMLKGVAIRHLAAWCRHCSKCSRSCTGMHPCRTSYCCLNEHLMRSGCCFQLCIQKAANAKLARPSDTLCVVQVFTQRTWWQTSATSSWRARVMAPTATL